MENKKLKVANFNISGGFYIGNEDTKFSSKIVKLLSDHFIIIDEVEI